MIERPDQVWCSDITYVPMPVGFMYLVVVMDWFSRYVLAWDTLQQLGGRILPRGLRSGLGPASTGNL